MFFIDPDGMQAISTSNIYDDRIQMTTAVNNEEYVENDDPGDKFATLREAARDFGKLYNGFSITNKTELHTIFYKTKDSEGNPYYTYSIPSKGNEGGVTFETVKSDIKSVLQDKNAEIVADGHSHGADDPINLGGGKVYSESNKFSDGTPLKNGDIQIYNNTYENGTTKGNPYGKPITGYVAAPNGGLLEYNPYQSYLDTGKVDGAGNKIMGYDVPIAKDLPSDPNSKNLRLNTISPNVIPNILPK